jgi:hypothetical protein
MHWGHLSNWLDPTPTVSSRIWKSDSFQRLSLSRRALGHSGRAGLHRKLLSQDVFQLCSTTLELILQCSHGPRGPVFHLSWQHTLAVPMWCWVCRYAKHKSYITGTLRHPPRCQRKLCHTYTHIQATCDRVRMPAGKPWKGNVWSYESEA